MSGVDWMLGDAPLRQYRTYAPSVPDIRSGPRTGVLARASTGHTGSTGTVPGASLLEVRLQLPGTPHTRAQYAYRARTTPSSVRITSAPPPYASSVPHSPEHAMPVPRTLPDTP
eukprot:3940876-Rhodomonas_salina.2